MEERSIIGYGSSRTLAVEVKLEEDEEEFRSCCADEEELKEREESSKQISKNDDLDEFSVHMFFKGVSIAEPGTGSGLSGIGVIMKGLDKVPVIEVQKKLDFFVEETVANYLALMDGLSEAKQNNIRRVFAFTDSESLFYQITNEETIENPLLMALKQRILEHSGSLDHFVLKRVCNIDLECPLRLAQVAIGIVSFTAKGDNLVENCSICCEDKIAPMLITMKCSHKFCSNCMRTYVDGKVQLSQVPIRCPDVKCRYYISSAECKSFLPVASYKSLERAVSKENVLNLDKLYCPFPNCSVLLDAHECLSTRVSSSNHSDNSCVECPVCHRFICLECGVPWHSSMSCEEYQELPIEERDAGDLTLNLADSKRWRRCQQCRRMIELTHGCYHMNCWCGHEFCYSCGAEYSNNQQTCQCAFWDEEHPEDLVTLPAQQFEQWAWDSFGSLSTMMDAYSDQERSQLALIQRFLAGGFSLSDHHPYQSPPRCTDSYVDTMKDLHQLPWLERFVSVISDNYYDEYTQ